MPANDHHYVQCMSEVVAAVNNANEADYAEHNTDDNSGDNRKHLVESKHQQCKRISCHPDCNNHRFSTIGQLLVFCVTLYEQTV